MAKKKLPADPNKKAKTILDMVTGDTPTSDEGKNPAAVAYRIKRSQFSSQLAELDLLKL